MRNKNLKPTVFSISELTSDQQKLVFALNYSEGTTPRYWVVCSSCGTPVPTDSSEYYSNLDEVTCQDCMLENETIIFQQCLHTLTKTGTGSYPIQLWDSLADRGFIQYIGNKPLQELLHQYEVIVDSQNYYHIR